MPSLAVKNFHENLTTSLANIELSSVLQVLLRVSLPRREAFFANQDKCDMSNCVPLNDEIKRRNYVRFTSELEAFGIKAKDHDFLACLPKTLIYLFDIRSGYINGFPWIESSCSALPECDYAGFLNHWNATQDNAASYFDSSLVDIAAMACASLTALNGDFMKQVSRVKNIHDELTGHIIVLIDPDNTKAPRDIVLAQSPAKIFDPLTLRSIVGNLQRYRSGD